MTKNARREAKRILLNNAAAGLSETMKNLNELIMMSAEDGYREEIVDLKALHESALGSLALVWDFLRPIYEEEERERNRCGTPPDAE